MQKQEDWKTEWNKRRTLKCTGMWIKSQQASGQWVWEAVVDFVFSDIKIVSTPMTGGNLLQFVLHQ